VDILRDRVAVITGGGNGIGRGMALALAEADTHVVIADIEAEAAQAVAKEVEQRGVRALAVRTDVTDRASLETLAERAYAEFGAVHILCNNAGVSTVGSLEQCSDEEWQWLLSVNLHGVINGIQTFLPRLLAQGGEAHIVNSGSLCSLAAFPLYGIYTTSKFALAGLTEALRLDLEHHGIGVSLLCPGLVRTRALASALTGPGKLREPGRHLTPEREQALAETRRAIEGGMDPLVVGHKVVEGVRRNDAYIITHPEFKGAIEARLQQILGAFDAAAARGAERPPAQKQPEAILKDLRGRVAVVTGGGSGIGRGMALAFADVGMHIVIPDIEGDAAEKVASEVRERGVRGLALRADVTQRRSMQEVAERTYAEFGATHVLCNNAGVSLVGSLSERTDADWEWALSVNLYGVLHGIQAFLPRMLAQGGDAHIVNTASIVGLMFAPGAGIYGTTKQALVGLSESLAMDLAQHGIGVSVVCPAGVRTRLTESARNRPAELVETRPDPAIEKMATDAINAGMDPLEVGRLVADAVRRNDLYVIPHPAAKPFVEQRFAQILAAFDAAASRASS
jgi:NAD(P)-dependent dehydrogenase (short-subunit alcohol dehydrogenase family)